MTEGYEGFASRLVATGVLSDPWLDGKPRFRDRPLVLAPATWERLATAAEELCGAFHEAVLLCATDAGLAARYVPLTPWLDRMWQAAAPAWHGIARADVFLTADGPKICEINCDTPSGEAEAVLLNRTACAGDLIDPNAELEARFCAVIEEAAAALGKRAPLTVGIVYPTELVEDLSMIALYAGWLEARGHRVVLGSPYNLAPGPSLFGRPLDVIFRHYKTDWWCERRPIWRDDPGFADAAPLSGPLAALLDGVENERCAVVNPLGAAVAQNKRLMALLWEEIDRFSPRTQAAVRAHLPYTARLETIAPERLRAERAAWVLKSDYGCEGAEVLLGSELDDATWARALALAMPDRFIVQRRFEPVADQAGEVVNHGVYLVAGCAAGIFARMHRGATGYDAVTVPTFIGESGRTS